MKNAVYEAQAKEKERKKKINAQVMKSSTTKKDRKRRACDEYLHQKGKGAKEIEAGDPIDWSSLPLQRDAVYNMLGLSVMERVVNAQDPTERELILLASLVKLTVENFVLEMQLRVDK